MAASTRIEQSYFDTAFLMLIVYSFVDDVLSP